MKNLFSFITLLIFVNTITNYKIGTEAKEEELPKAVLDTDGNEILAGNSYYILPIIRGKGGGLTAEVTEGRCVYGVVQENFFLSSGEPLLFVPDEYKLGDVIHEFTDLNIGFVRNYGCRPSNIWKVDDYDESTKQNFVMLGGSAGNPGNETVANWFKFEKHTSGDYKIVFCPSVCDFCSVTCSDVGIYVQKGLLRLALSEVPFLVKFKKVGLWDHEKY